MKSTQAMRDRIRELMTDPIDDYDRAVLCALDDLEHLLSLPQEAPEQAAKKPAIDPKQIKAVDDFLADGQRDKGYRAFAMMRHLWPRLRELALASSEDK